MPLNRFKQESLCLCSGANTVEGFEAGKAGEFDDWQAMDIRWWIRMLWALSTSLDPHLGQQ